ncbi:hypothetical protein SH668x_002139 [Planctomicrobium sp. SH668]|uniref:hypothetical protein n=1 Tax=Planctomicrobium sp. SH668 TaxID=3448126 RepID=UPI003F5B3C23
MYRLALCVLLLCLGCGKPVEEASTTLPPPPREMQQALQKLHANQPKYQLQAMQLIQGDPRIIKHQEQRLKWLSENGANAKVKDKSLELLKSIETSVPTE